jgi:hypothetical protein
MVQQPMVQVDQSSQSHSYVTAASATAALGNGFHYASQYHQQQHPGSMNHITGNGGYPQQQLQQQLVSYHPSPSIRASASSFASASFGGGNYRAVLQHGGGGGGHGGRASPSPVLLVTLLHPHHSDDANRASLIGRMKVRECYELVLRRETEPISSEGLPAATPSSCLCLLVCPVTIAALQPFNSSERPELVALEAHQPKDLSQRERIWVACPTVQEVYGQLRTLRQLADELAPEHWAVWNLFADWLNPVGCVILRGVLFCRQHPAHHLLLQERSTQGAN